MTGHVHMRPDAARIPVHPRSWLERKHAQLKARKRNRDRHHRLRHGHRAQREAAAVRRIRREIEHVESFLSKPRTMFDCVTVSTIPADAPAAAGYVGGSWPTFESGALRAHLPHALLIGIAVSSSHIAECIDCEPGDASPADVPGFVLREHGLGTPRPLVYAAVSEMNECLEALDDAGVHPDAYRIGTAHVGAGKHICGPGTCGLLPVKADGTQWTWTSRGLSLDEWVLRPSFWVGRKSPMKERA